MTCPIVSPCPDLFDLPCRLQPSGERLPKLTTHSLGVARMSLKVARAFGFAGQELVQIVLGAAFHDVGKAALPGEVLNKPGALSESEWSIVRLHPLIGLRILSRIPILQPAAEVAYLHHERWGGRGYPLGLRGEQIPLSARICAVVDVWDALTHDRPYRQAWSHHQARAYLRQGAGVQFDPQVVEVFLQILSELGE